jgi:hypothetical protein
VSLGAGIFQFLTAELGHDRVYPLTLPQGVTLPAITYQVISEIPLRSHSTAQDHPAPDLVPLGETRVQFSVYGQDYDEAEEVMAVLKTAISGFRGLWGDVDVQSALPDIGLDDYEPDTRLWRRLVDVMVWHSGGTYGSS